MKPKKLMKRIIESRGSKKTAKKVAKRNKKFLTNLCCLGFDIVDEKPQEVHDTTPRTIVCESLESKRDMLKYIKDVIASSNTVLDEEMVSATPVQAFELGVFTFTFYNKDNPYRILVSKDINIENLKSIKADVVIEKNHVDPDPDTN